MSIGDYDNKRYCGSVALQSASPARTQGAYSQFSIPLSQFSCPFAVSSASQARSIPLSVADSANLLGPETRTLVFCVPGVLTCVSAGTRVSVHSVQKRLVSATLGRAGMGSGMSAICIQSVERAA